MSTINKLQKFEENRQFSHVYQPNFDEVFQKDYKLKGKWRKEVFKNDNPIVLELACGKGEYTVGQAQLFPEKNFIGIDIKGARIWRGARQVYERKLENAAFIRTRIDFIESIFDKDEIDEIWIIFPDPQHKKPLKRLTSSRFLNRYINVMKENATVNLKTDNPELFEYTNKLAQENNLTIEISTPDIYNSTFNNEVLSIKTFYEKQWLEEGRISKYIRFKLPHQTIIEPKDEE